MTSRSGMQASRDRSGWRRAVTGSVAGSALALGLLVGFGSATAHADVLDDVYSEYATGAGGGQVSNWAKESMQLRALGFKPSKGNIEDLQSSLKYKPNQTPLVEALKETVAYQRKIQAQSQAGGGGGGGGTIGINQNAPGQVPYPGGGGIFGGPNGGGGIVLPVG
ncbi:hypothetical protein M1247_32940 [Mycobacterium sp. 21AC1]|uniref:hypothetical protein n=1 Tax=[Mycobacterium] appelbergii TaxID=2939269 RepID=UPI002939507B|nr:hypothetical protein [Mycobacterium sp. 21AC1]MDV3129752.1 hypothetical protein [Mycobacterium sp. 21AC1]